jgi:hypothetical protein
MEAPYLLYEHYFSQSLDRPELAHVIANLERSRVDLPDLLSFGRWHQYELYWKDPETLKSCLAGTLRKTVHGWVAVGANGKCLASDAPQEVAENRILLWTFIRQLKVSRTPGPDSYELYYHPAEATPPVFCGRVISTVIHDDERGFGPHVDWSIQEVSGRVVGVMDHERAEFLLLYRMLLEWGTR